MLKDLWEIIFIKKKPIITKLSVRWDINGMFNNKST